jgi:hypothetical protein
MVSNIAVAAYETDLDLELDVKTLQRELNRKFVRLSLPLLERAARRTFG